MAKKPVEDVQVDAVEQAAPPVVDDNQDNVEPKVDEQPPVDDEKKDGDAPAAEDDGKVDVELIGTPAQKSGHHEHFFDNIKHVVFVDGIAHVEKELAKLLKELGLVK